MTKALISAQTIVPVRLNEHKGNVPSRVGESKFNINKLPDELLRGIFCLGLDSLGSSDQIRLTPTSHREWERARLRFLAAITSVCFLWRELAISTPSLWRTLSLAHTKPEDNTMRLILHRLETFLSRSNGVSLDMFLYVGVDKRSQRPAVRVLVDHITRCRSFHLVSHSQGETIDFLPLPGAMPLLTSLFIEVIALPRSRPLTEILSEENVAPLRNLRLHVGHASAVIPTRMANLLEAIRTEDLQDVSLSAPEEEWTESIRFLERCRTSVQAVDIAMPQPYTSFHAPPTITLPNVSSLGFGDYLPLGLDAFVHTPNVEELTIHGDTGFRHRRDRTHRTTRAHSDVDAFVYPHLRSLTLHDFNFVTQDLPDLHQLFSRNPTIETVTIRECEGSFIVLHALLLGGLGFGRGSTQFNTQTPVLFGPSTLLPPPPSSVASATILPSFKKLVISDSGAPGRYSFRFEHEFTQLLGQVMRRPGWERLVVECDWRSLDVEGDEVASFRKEYGGRLVEVGTGWE